MSKRIIRPNQVSIETLYSQGHLAAPISVAMQGKDGSMKLVVAGGLTKAEQLAAQLADRGAFPQTDEDWPKVRKRAASLALDMAEAILAESERRQRPHENNGTS